MYILYDCDWDMQQGPLMLCHNPLTNQSMFGLSWGTLTLPSQQLCMQMLELSTRHTSICNRCTLPPQKAPLMITEKCGLLFGLFIETQMASQHALGKAGMPGAQG